MTANIARKVVCRPFNFKPHRCRLMTPRFSPREREVLELLARGYLYKEIADSLSISLPTVNTYIRRIYEKLHVRSRAQATPSSRTSRCPGRGSSLAADASLTS